MTKELTLADIALQLNVVTDEIRLLAETMSDFATNVDGRFNQVDQRFDRLESRMTGMETKITGVEIRMTGMETKMTGIGAMMVTKEYLDDKLADLRADLVVLARKGDRKLSELVDELVHQGSLSKDAAHKIMALEPFPQR